MAFENVTINYDGVSFWLRTSEDLAAALKAHAEVGVAYGKSIAPVGPARDPHRGEFRDSIRSESTTLPGGIRAARIYAGPLWPEFGRHIVNPYQGAHTLRQVRTYLNSPKRRA